MSGHLYCFSTCADRSEKVKPQTQHTLNFLAEPSTAGLDDRFLKHMFTLVYQAVASNLVRREVCPKLAGGLCIHSS